MGDSHFDHYTKLQENKKKKKKKQSGCQYSQGIPEFSLF
jgi:hypothetical protein